MTTPAPRNVTATDAERAALLSTPCRPWLRLLMLLCSDLAIRSGTAANLRGCDFDVGAGTVSFVTKFAQAQTLPVTQETALLLARAAALAPLASAVGTLAGGRVPAYHEAWKRHRRKAGVQRAIRLHDLRRTTAVAVYELTRDLRKVQALLGHRSLPTTLHYLDHRITTVDLSVLNMAAMPRSGRVQ